MGISRTRLIYRNIQRFQSIASSRTSIPGMHRFRTIISVFVFAVLCWVNNQTSAECCGWSVNNICNHVTVPPDKWCCGKGECNIFCCNCDGGCVGPISKHS